MSITRSQAKESKRPASARSAKPLGKTSTRTAARSRSREADEHALALHSRGPGRSPDRAGLSAADKRDLTQAGLKDATIDELDKLCGDWSEVRQHTLRASGSARAELLDIVAHHAAGLKAALERIDRGDESEIFARVTRDEWPTFRDGPASVLSLDLQLDQFTKGMSEFVNRLGRLAQYAAEVAEPLRGRGGRPSSGDAAVWFIEQIGQIVRGDIDIDQRKRGDTRFDAVCEVCFRVAMIPNGVGGNLAIDGPMASYRERRAWSNPACQSKD